MKPVDFEDYLQEKHAEQYVGLDDGMVDDFNDWLCSLDPQEIIDFADAHGKKMFLAGMDRAIERLKV